MPGATGCAPASVQAASPPRVWVRLAASEISSRATSLPTTRAPAPVSLSVITRPIARPTPVTRATLPASDPADTKASGLVNGRRPAEGRGTCGPDRLGNRCGLDGALLGHRCGMHRLRQLPRLWPGDLAHPVLRDLADLEDELGPLRLGQPEF